MDNQSQRVRDTDLKTFVHVLELLVHRYPLEDWSTDLTPFGVLVAVVISQNTTVANERQALQRLRERVGLTPQALREASVADLEAALRPAGLFRMKARRLREIASRLRTEEHLATLLAQPLEVARRDLLALPGVGPKTADVVLSLVAGRPVLPVDTHIWRIARRWELAGGRDYEEVRGALEAGVPPSLRQRAHLTLIRFGREVCTARRPKCLLCPVARPCPFYAKIRSGELQVPLFQP